MRDDKDPGTIEMQLPKRRGRPPKNGVCAQTPADYMREYRFKRKIAAQCAYRMEVSDAAMIDALRDAMRRGEAKYALDLLADLRMRVHESMAD
ncbi:hypothetical protein K4A87_09145 [Xanthomonas fragariae]|uniref:hypothetical protein n=1 Tax=Xanthomonas fragariae TaxID=48664 RepID=UPI001EDD8729|nr:hypothetical protein [Xanthomonas fragariae]UKR53944.1 hypothetical protein K4A87_09080 [Xanthomonas fragariae]UKR53952.1 hypothetical protein K4A87_09145 [Xanthomonas fragariae]